MILHNFGVVNEYKYQQKMTSDVKKYILNTRVIQIPEAWNHQFIIFISTSDEFPLRIKFENTVNINFAPDVDNCDDD